MRTISISRWPWLCLVLIAAMTWPLVAAAQEDVEAPASPPSPEDAAPIYGARCANCHGAGGQGDGPEAVQAGVSMPDLTDPTIWRQTTPARWFDIISNGVADTAMPPFGEGVSNPLDTMDRWNLVYYLYTLSTPPAQVRMGQALYDRDCVECHGGDGSGNADTPSFTDLAAMTTQSQTDVFAAIADTAIEGHDLGLGEVETWALADYIRSFSYQYAEPSAINVPFVSGAPAAANPFTGGEGVVSGRVINGTTGATLTEELAVSLHAFDMNATYVDEITTTVAADGSFRFEGIDPTAQVQFEPRAVYQNISYISDLDATIVLSEEQPEATANITVFETTQDDSAIRIERLHIVFDFAQGQVQVAELYILSNDGDRAYVGTLEEGTLRFTLPPNTLNFQPGGDPNRFLTLADGVADTIPIPPGQGTAESILIFDLAYSDELELSRPLPYDVNMVNIFSPADAGIVISGDKIRSGGSFEAQGSTLDSYMADDLSASDRLTIKLSGKPEIERSTSASLPHQTSGPNKTQSIAIGLIALAGAVALAYLYLRGHLNLRLKATNHDQQSASLLQAIADLDDDFEAGELDEESYRVQRARLKKELIELMHRER